MTTVVRALALVSVLLSACGSPVAQPSPTVAPTPESTATASVAPEPTTSVASEPTAFPLPVPGPRIETPEVVLDPGPIPFAFAALRAPVPDAEAESVAREGVGRYLMGLDWYRNGSGQGDRLPVSGRFAEVVKAGLDSSVTPGVKRGFVLESMVIERYLVKPWGIPALAEVRVTIVDRAIEGTAPDQRETGRLRLLGDRLGVVDGWDYANQRWFNDDLELMSEPKLRAFVQPPLGNYLRFETWLPGSPLETGFGPGTNTFWDARHKYVASFDREKIVSRTFAGVTGRIELFETFAELEHGLATVHLTGTVVSVDASGKEIRESFQRRVIILIGNWGAELVDEEISPGVWVSAGTLMATLKERDRNFA